MSVINQMLKDLQQRQGENQAEMLNQGVAGERPNSTTHHLWLVIIVSVFVTLIAVYVFQLRDENQRYKNEKDYQQQQANSPVTNHVTNPETKQVNQQIQSTANTENRPIVAVNKSAVSNLPVEKSDLLIEKKIVVPEHNVLTDVVMPVKTEAKLVIEPVIKENSVIKVAKTNVPSSMKITRQQMTPKMLAKQKMNRAKEAIANDEMARAEQLFEDVILILPEQKDARKQLAALWFGRKSYRAALNLLSQGIHLDPFDNELRMLKARIYIQQKQHLQAFQVLQSLPNVDQITAIEFQSLLATEAQKAGQFDYAITSYLRLVKQETTSGRWWLGLAIAYDSDSQFVLASQAYKKALAQQNISASAVKFAQGRIVELGE